MLSISIIIPTYNRKRLLAQCLRSIEKQTYTNKEIIVVDDASTDGTLPYIKKFFPDVKVIRNNINLGPACAKNQGILNSSGRYIYFLDSDSELLNNNTLSEMLSFMDKDPSIGCLGGIAERNRTSGTIFSYGKIVKLAGITHPRILRSEYGKISNDLVQCDFLPTCNCFTRRELALKVGGFDPYYIYQGEDKEFGLKIKSLGYKNMFSHKTSCMHKYDESIAYDRYFYFFKTRTRFLIKNCCPFYLLILPFLDLFVFILYYPFLYFTDKIFPQFEIFKTFQIKKNPSYKPPKIRQLLKFPYYFLNSYIHNLIIIKHTLSCRKNNFLRIDTLNAYIAARHRNQIRHNSIINRIRLYLFNKFNNNKPSLYKTILKKINLFRTKKAINLSHPKNLILFITNKCQLSCKFCFYEKNRNMQSREMSLREINLIANELRNIFHITITGGEPFLRKDIPLICKAFLKNSTLNFITIPTNGFSSKTIYKTTEKILNISRKNLKICISIDGLSKNHNQLRNSNYSFNKAVTTLQLLKKLQKKHKNLLVEISTIITPSLISETELFIDFFQQFRVPIKFSIPRTYDSAIINLGDKYKSNLHSKTNDISLSLEDLTAFIKKISYLNIISPYKFLSNFQILKLENSIKIAQKREKLFNCYAGKIDIVIYPDTSVGFCENTIPIGSLRNSNFNFKKLWNSPAAKQLRTKTEQCTCALPCNLITAMLHDTGCLLSLLEP
ncbi:MAG: glycosyltransferase [Candidatus Omnitrophota bacterium]